MRDGGWGTSDLHDRRFGGRWEWVVRVRGGGVAAACQPVASVVTLAGMSRSRVFSLLLAFPVFFPSAAVAATFAFELRPEGSSLRGNIAVTAESGGSLRGDYEAGTNPGGTRTKPGLFGSFGSTENVPVPVELSPALRGPLVSVPSGVFQLGVNEDVGTVVLSGLAVNLLAGGPVVIPTEVTFAFGSFRTRTPDSLFIGGFPFTVPLGESRLTSLAAAQIGSAAGELSAAGTDLWDFSISTLLVVSGVLESPLGVTELPPVTVPYTLNGRIQQTGDTAMVTAASAFAFLQSEETALDLPDLPFPLPTILPAGGTANIVLDLTLSALTAELDATFSLVAPGRAIPEPATSLVVGGLGWIALRRRRRPVGR